MLPVLLMPLLLCAWPGVPVSLVEGYGEARVTGQGEAGVNRLHFLYRPYRCVGDPGPGFPRGMELATVLRAAEAGLNSDPPVVAARSAILLARKRALFLSAVMQLNNNSVEFPRQPALWYYYLSSATATTILPSHVLGAGVAFSNKTHYPNWYKSVPFNSTLKAFEPRALRLGSELRVVDYGAFPDDRLEWDMPRRPDYIETNRLTVRDENGDLRDRTFFSAPTEFPPRFSDAAFDCEDGGRFLTTVSAPVVDVLARYTLWLHLQRARYVADVTLDMDAEKLLAEVTSYGPLFHDALAPMTNCPNTTPAPGSTSVGSSFFRALYPQARLALHAAQTLSAYLQVPAAINGSDEWRLANQIVGYTVPPSFMIKMDGPLSVSTLESEAVSLVLADPSVTAASVAFDPRGVSNNGNDDGLPTVLAWRSGEKTRVEQMSPAVDPARLMMGRAQVEWTSSRISSRLTRHPLHAFIRSSEEGGGLARFAVDPVSFRAVDLNVGYQWSYPYFKCDGRVDTWVVTYAAPFFGPASQGAELEFKGLVTVDISVTADNWNV